MAKKSDKKRKRQEEDNDGTDVINAQLRAYGKLEHLYYRVIFTECIFVNSNVFK